MRKGNNKNGNPNFKGASNPKIKQTLEHPLWPGESKKKGITISLPERVYREIILEKEGKNNCPKEVKLSIEHLIEAVSKSNIDFDKEAVDISSTTESNKNSFTVKIEFKLN